MKLQELKNKIIELTNLSKKCELYEGFGECGKDLEGNLLFRAKVKYVYKITFEDVLVALSRKPFECESYAFNLIIRTRAGECRWQLNKSLEEQSEETINFLHKILV